MLFKKKKEPNKEVRDITIAKLCRWFGVAVPDEVAGISEEVNNDVCMKFKITKGSIYALILEDLDPVSTAEKAAENGAVIFFADKKHQGVIPAEIQHMPVVFVEDLIGKVTGYYREIRRSYNLKTVAVTGSVGKTTTKNFLRLALDESYSVYYSVRNKNSARSVAHNVAVRLSDDQDIYVQEVGAGEKGLVRFSARILEADVFILTNVHEHHLNTYGSFENLLEDKLSIQDYMPKNGVIIANFDDPGTARAEFKRKVISVGIETKAQVDYRGANIRQNNEFLEMDVIYGRRTQHLRVKVMGVHNAYNVLQAFAAARVLKVPDELSAKGIQRHRSGGLRQHIANIGGYRLYMDCYNVCGASILAGIKTMEEYRLTEGSKKIAILGGENKMGSNVRSATYELGLQLAKSNIDYILCFGSPGESAEELEIYGDGRSLCRGLLDGGFTRTEFISDRKMLIERIRQLSSPGDLLLFKGIWLLHMAQIADSVFGSCFSFDYPYYKVNGRKLQEGDFTAKQIQCMDDLEITEFRDDGQRYIAIPEQIQGCSICRLGDRLFAGNQSLEEIDLGSSISGIGRGAFSGCSSLKRIEIPASVKVIFKDAFKDCTSLQEAVLHEGLTHIGPGAFRGCPNLQKVVIPDSVGFVSKTAFDETK